jgi:hypothetical protein
MALLYRISLNRPLSNSELDGNFSYLNTEVEAPYKTVEFTAAKISTKLNTPAVGQTSTELIESNAINSWLLRGYYPSNLTPTITNKESIVTRDSLGNFSANVITANLTGTADLATNAGHATLAGGLDSGVILSTAQGGTSSSSPTDARTTLAVLGTAGGEQMTGTLRLVTSLIGLPSLRFGIGADVESASALDGDIWFTANGIRYKVSGSIQTVAKVNSPTFTGTPQAPNANNVSSQIATVDHVTASKNSLFDNIANINSTNKIDLKSPIASPTFTGTPSAPTPADLTNTTQIATTAFVQSVASTKADAAESAAKSYVDGLISSSNDTVSGDIALKANIASPTFTGTPEAPTPTDNSTTTRVATTGYTVNYVAATILNYYTKTEIDNYQDKWGTSKKYVQTSEPTEASNGDFWFKI